MADAKKTSKVQGAGGGVGKHNPDNRDPLAPKDGEPGSIGDALAKENPIKSLRNSRFINKKLDALKDTILSRDANGNLKMSNEEFNKNVAKLAVDKLKQARDLGMMQGGVMRIPKEGKAIVVGDLHEQATNLTAILEHAKLDKNPDTKLVILGDVLSGSKTSRTDETGGGDSMHRVISWLQARYPDQVFVVNGNHEMGMMAGVNKMEGKKASGAMGRMEARLFTDKEQVINRIKESPLQIQIGDKAKGEHTRTFQHAPGQGNIEEVAKLNTPEERNVKAVDIFESGENLTKEAFQKINEGNKSDLTYFGHVSPEALEKGISDGSLKPEANNGVISKFEGGGVFVDSQMQDVSGIVEIDLNKDSAPEKMISMKDLRENYSKSKGHSEGLREFGGSDKDTFRGQLSTVRNEPVPPKQPQLSPTEQKALMEDLLGSVKGADW